MSDEDGHCWAEVLAGEQAPAMHEHLRSCEECALMVGHVDRAADAVRAGLPPAPAGLDARVLDTVADAERAALPRPRRLPRVAVRRVGLPAGLAAVAAVLTLTLVLRPGAVSEVSAAVPIGPLTGSCGPRDGRIVVAGQWSGREAVRFTRVLERFERRTGVRVRYAYESRQMAAALQSRVRRGCPPAVALLSQPGLMADLARRGQILPIDTAAGDGVRANYTSAWRELGTVDGRLYGVWFKAADKSMFWYSARTFRAAGIRRPPRSWPELLAAARKLAAAGITPFSVAGADGWTLTDWFENVYLRTAGPERYQRLAEHAIPWTDPSVGLALRRLALVFGDRALVGPAADAMRTTFPQSVAAVFADRPRAAMVYEGDFVRGFLPARRAGAARAAGDVRFFPFPGPGADSPPAAVVGGDVAVAFALSPGARRLIRFLATAAAAEPWARAGGFVSPNRRLSPRVYPDALTRAAARALTRARTVRFDLSDLQPPAFGATAEQGMWKTFQELLVAPTEIDAATRRLEVAATAAHACERAIRGRC